MLQQHVRGFLFSQHWIHTSNLRCILSLFSAPRGFGTATASGLVLLMGGSWSIRALSYRSGDALSCSPSPHSSLVESTSLHLSSLLLEAKHPHTYMKSMHFGAQTHFVHKHVCAHAHWIFNLCPIFQPFGSLPWLQRSLGGRSFTV